MCVRSMKRAVQIRAVLLFIVQLPPVFCNFIEMRLGTLGYFDGASFPDAVPKL